MRRKPGEQKTAILAIGPTALRRGSRHSSSRRGNVLPVYNSRHGLSMALPLGQGLEGLFAQKGNEVGLRPLALGSSDATPAEPELTGCLREGCAANLRWSYQLPERATS